MPARQKRDNTLVKATDKELDAISEVGPRDIPKADLEWRRVAPKPFRNALASKEE